MRRLAERVKVRIERACAMRGVTYPWWIPASSVSACVLLTFIALGQRGGIYAPFIVMVGAALALIPLVVWAFFTRLLPKEIEAAVMLTGVALIMTKSVHGPDFAPLILTLAAAEVTAIAEPLMAAAVTGVAFGIVGFAAARQHLVGASIYLVGIALGVWVGIALRWQMRAITAERQSREAAQEQAVAAERQRIAREVHDVVGHALSVTLLHLTGARLALSQDRDIDEAITALTDAERVGRAAMADLRSSVGLLATNSVGTEPLPGLDDLEGLVERTRNAGVDVTLDVAGDLTAVGTSSGLGLYRLAQESLANIVKHAPASHAVVRLTVEPHEVRLTIRNSLGTFEPVIGVGGIGLPGMAARAEQLGASLKAGPDGAEWVVDVIVPVRTVDTARQVAT